MPPEMDRRISTPKECASCEGMLMASAPDPDGFVVCPSCFHSHPVTPRAFLAVAKQAAESAKEPHPGATVGM